MDNQNNPNSPTNPNPPQPQIPAEPTLPPPPPLSSIPSWPPAPEPATPSAGPTTTPTFPSSMPQDTSQANPGTGADLSSAWSPLTPTQPQPQPAAQAEPSPIQPEPTVSNPWSNPQTPMDPMSQQASIWTPPASAGPEPISQPQMQTPQSEPNLPLSEPAPTQTAAIPPSAEPTPTFTPPTINPTGGGSEPLSATSPLNNPWETAPANPTQPSWMNAQAPNTSPASTETAPTDLSHLISNNNQQEQTSMPTAESLVMPSNGANPEVPNLPTETHKGMPKWLIGLGIGLLIIVLGASAYFILGIGQPSKDTTSLPATTTPQTTQVKPPLPIATASAQPSESTGSANFGQIGGTMPATSAADLIRQRQQGK